jgi:hypothetical protein
MFVFSQERIQLISSRAGYQPPADTVHPATPLMGNGTVTTWYEHTRPEIVGI